VARPAVRAGGGERRLLTGRGPLESWGSSRGVGVRRLRPGPSSLGSEEVAGIQRARLLDAMSALAVERGLNRVSVAHVLARARVSRRTFYEMFADREACFLAVYEDAVERAAARVVPARGRGRSGRDCQDLWCAVRECCGKRLRLLVRWARVQVAPGGGKRAVPHRLLDRHDIDPAHCEQ
jgi:AcrR family transcriptional regulator